MATKYWLILALSLLLAPALFAVPVQCDTAATFADLIQTVPELRFQRNSAQRTDSDGQQYRR
jgi:hypothetical protein